MTSSMTVAERRSNEQHLLRHYLELMKARGCEMPSFEDAWEQYCLWPIHGLASFNGSRDEWQLPGSILAGVERFSAAIEDHESVQRMGRISRR